MDASVPPERLTFAQLEAQIEAMPEGPVAALKSPEWIRWANLIGVTGIVIGVLPQVLVHLMTPQMWMVWIARAGLAFAALGFAPQFARSVIVTFRELRNHRKGFVEQFDHDVEHFRALVDRLSRAPTDHLDTLERYARMGHERMDSRLAQLVGGLERVGMLPILLSLIVLLRDWESLLDTPLWLAMLALMAPILWFIGWVANEFRRRLQLYEFLMYEAKLLKASRGER